MTNTWSKHNFFQSYWNWEYFRLSRLWLPWEGRSEWHLHMNKRFYEQKTQRLHIDNKSGPRIDPWGTLQIRETLCSLSKVSLFCVNCCWWRVTLWDFGNHLNYLVTSQFNPCLDKPLLFLEELSCNSNFKPWSCWVCSAMNLWTTSRLKENVTPSFKGLKLYLKLYAVLISHLLFVYWWRTCLMQMCCSSRPCSSSFSLEEDTVPLWDTSCDCLWKAQTPSWAVLPDFPNCDQEGHLRLSLKVFK